MHFSRLTPCHQVNSLKNLLHEQFQYFLMNNQDILAWKNFYHRNGALGTNNLKLHQHTSPKVPAPSPGCPISLDNSEQDNATSCTSSYHRWRCTSQSSIPSPGPLASVFSSSSLINILQGLTCYKTNGFVSSYQQ